MTRLPPFPVDDATLDLLEQAMSPWDHGEPDAECSSVEAVLTLLSELGGSDSTAVEEDLGSHQVMRDPGYHTHNVIAALITEVRRLRREMEDQRGRIW